MIVATGNQMRFEASFFPPTEQVVRKLLVASQKGGVGKTTTSINLAAATALAGARVLLLDADPLSSISSSLNLAEHPERQTLRQAGIDLPGVIVSSVVPGLDVLSPYEDGGCSDEELNSLLTMLAAPSLQERYGCLLVDTPPFMGANPSQLLAACSEFILVMRAEPLAYRTLPAFLELVQRSRGDTIAMRGILLTLPEGEQPGGRWERELRGRFGTRILSRVVPHDEAVIQAVLFGKIASHDSKDSPAAAAYHSLVETLALATEARNSSEHTSAAAALLQASTAARIGATRSRSRSAIVGKAADTSCSETPAPCDRSPASLLAAGLPCVAPINPPERPASPSRRRTSTINPAPVVPSADEHNPVTPRAPASTADVPAPSPPKTNPSANAPESFPLGLGVWSVALAMLAGISLRFLKLPDFALPSLVGVGVALVVVLLMRSFQSPTPAATKTAPRKPPPRRSEARPDPGKRLSGLKRRISAATRNVHGD